ncbi:hypothetical protein ACHWQZ_G008457 [Mnemiopsis leidyi]
MKTSHASLANLCCFLVAGLAAITVTPGNKVKVDKGGTAFTLSCDFSGLSMGLSEVVWTKNGTDVRTLSDGTTYKPDVGAGSYDNNTGTQTSTLTVSGSDSTRDEMEFVCEVTYPADNSTTENATVHLKFYSVASTAMSITVHSDQELTCNISGLDDDQPVSVTWKDPDGNTVNNDTNYSLDPGTVDDNGSQAAVLTIKKVKMETYKSTFTYKCSARSTQYPGSPPSSDVDVIVNLIICDDDRQCANGNCSDTNQCVCDESAHFKLNKTNPNICELTCSEDYCLNSGECIVSASATLQCNCQTGTEGVKCANFTSDPCAENPCKNEGHCSRDMNNPTDYTNHVCNCTSGFSGDNCEEIGSDKKEISEEVIVGAAVGGTVVLLGAAVFLLIIIKKNTTKVAVATVQINFQGTGEGTVQTHYASK